MRRFSIEHLVSEVEGRAVQGDSQEYLVYYTSENDLPSLVRLLGSNKAGGSDLRLHKLKKSTWWHGLDDKILLWSDDGKGFEYMFKTKLFLKASTYLSYSRHM
ncbi:hypothetical protein O6H91_10G071100 [Diphasiastrum complanatum]|uniref:Uncharacterized protein n=1 Tax=Diphasiastrum complanatum TaxID=34168 RepID=A0ACC2CI40_DIPCM|nr:hypothetical protein O6H91_10G071100 [Diphasiastrum complanatum]